MINILPDTHISFEFSTSAVQMIEHNDKLYMLDTDGIVYVISENNVEYHDVGNIEDILGITIDGDGYVAVVSTMSYSRIWIDYIDGYPNYSEESFCLNDNDVDENVLYNWGDVYSIMYDPETETNIKYKDVFSKFKKVKQIKKEISLPNINEKIQGKISSKNWIGFISENNNAHFYKKNK